MPSIMRRRVFEVIEGDNVFETQFEPVEDTPIVQNNGNKTTVAYLTVDQDGAGAFYFDDNDEGEYYGQNPRNLGHKHLEPEEAYQLERANPGRVFRIDKYEHGLVKYYRAGGPLEAAIPDKQWDVSACAAIYVAPDDCPDPAEYCDIAMETFSAWCNGEIYVAVVEVFERDGDNWTRASVDSCGGCIGMTHAMGVLKSDMMGMKEGE